MGVKNGNKQTPEKGNRFKGNVGDTSERRGGARMGFSERTDTILNRTELNLKNLTAGIIIIMRGQKACYLHYILFH